MKKLIVSTIAAAAIATTASAEVKVGVGIDVMTSITNPVANATSGQGFANNIGSTAMIRIPVDGVVDGLRIEPRIAYATSKNDNNTGVAGTADEATLTAFGLGAYWNLTKLIAVGASYDMLTLNAGNSGTTADTKGSSLAVTLKAETEIAKNFTISSELGFASTTTTPSTAGAKDMTDLAPVTSVTFRYFF